MRDKVVWVAVKVRVSVSADGSQLAASLGDLLSGAGLSGEWGKPFVMLQSDVLEGGVADREMPFFARE